MTDKLKTLMHTQAESVDFATPDLDAMVRTGDRRRRTRRLGAAGAVAATVAGVALVATTLAPGQRAVEPAGPAGPAAAPVSWVEGSTLHEGGQTFDLDLRPLAYVRTGVGYVFSDRQGRVWSWVAGDVKEVGRIDPADPHLVSDEESDLAGWLDPDEGSYAVLDQRPNGSVVYHQAPQRSDPSDFVGLDAGAAYWTTDAGLVAFDLGTGRTTPLQVDGTVADVEDGLLAVRTDAGISVRTVAGEELRLLDDFHGELGSFSPDARYFTNDADVPQVYDVASGSRVEVPVGTREFASGYEWLDGTTLALIAAAEASDDSRVQLLTCTVPDGGCASVATLMSFDEAIGRLVIPVGTAIDG
jgi:hypothetical protein